MTLTTPTVSAEAPRSPRARRVFVLGATGTIGRATVRALVRRGHQVVCLVRPRAGVGAMLDPSGSARLLAGADVRVGEVQDVESLRNDGFRGERFDVLVSCLASRTGAPPDAWAIDHRANVQAFEAARSAGVSHIVLLSAICVQKPAPRFPARQTCVRASADGIRRDVLHRPADRVLQIAVGAGGAGEAG